MLGLKVESKLGAKREVPWIEKYRPTNLDEIVFQNEVVTILKRCIETGDFPNSLLYGPPGTGKTSTILAMAKQLFGPEHYQDRILELNASDERGISVIRDKVKKFAQVSVSLGATYNGKILPPYKIIILDEADSMTTAAQAALRRIMEKQIKTTRFCIICNYISRIIEPITSRCSKFRFKPLPFTNMLSTLSMISNKESININEGTLLKLLEFTNGDLRKAILFLHTAFLYCGNDKNITNDIIVEVCGYIPENVLSRLITMFKGRSFNEMLKFCSDFIASGYSLTQLFPSILQFILSTDDILDLKKALALEKISECEAAVNLGSDEYLQLISLCSTLLNIYNN